MRRHNLPTRSFATSHRIAPSLWLDHPNRTCQGVFNRDNVREDRAVRAHLHGRRYSASLILILSLLSVRLGHAQTAARAAATGDQRTASAYQKTPGLHARRRTGDASLPLVFTRNQGQAPAGSLYVAQAWNMQTLLDRSGLTLRVAYPASGSTSLTRPGTGKPSALAGPSASTDADMQFSVKQEHIRFFRANPDVTLEPMDEQSGTVNYFLGKDQSRWIHGLKTYARVKYHNLYPGIDVVFYSHGGKLEYDFIVAAGADPSQIRFQMEGDLAQHITEHGALAFSSEGGTVLHTPLLYQNAANGKRLIQGKFALHADNTLGFQFAGYDKTKTFIIDPTVNLLYSTYVGGVHDDEAQDIVLDKQDNSYIVGFSASQNFPVSANAYQTTRKNIGTYVRNVVVAKFSPSGSLLYSTFIGGSVNDYGYSIAIDSSNDAFVTGYTNSPDYPTTAGSIQSALSSGGKTAFLSELSPDGTTLKYSTYYGPTSSGGISRPYQVIADSKNNIYLAGYSGSGLPTTTGVYKANLATSAGQSGFIAIFNFLQATGSPLVAATYYGTDTPESNTTFTGNRILGLTLDDNGNIWFAGQAYTNNLPTTANALQPKLNPLGPCAAGAVPLNSAGFFGEISPNLQNLLYASYLSGQTEAAAEASCSEWAWKLAFDPSGNLYVYGDTASDKFPVTSGALETAFPGSGDGGWVSDLVKLGSNGTKILWGTYIGGQPGQTFPANVVVDAAGNPWIAGFTQATNFPSVGDSYQASLAGVQNGFIMELNPNGSQAQYFTYLGGSGTDSLNGMTLDSADNIYVVGATNSTNFPVTSDAFQSTLAPDKLDGNNWFFSELGSGTISVVGQTTFGNAGDGTLTVDGSGIDQGATCELVQGSTVIEATAGSVNSAGTSMSCNFALDGALTGSYNIVITNPNGGGTLTAANAVTVQSGGQPNLSVQIVGRSAIRIGVSTPFYINVTNSGTQDAYITPVWVSIPTGITFTINGYTQAQSQGFATTVGNNMYVELYVAHLAAGATQSIPLEIASATGSPQIGLIATLQPPWFGSVADIETAANSVGSTYTPGCVQSTASSYYQNCLGTALFYAQSTQMGFTPPVIPTIPNPPFQQEQAGGNPNFRSPANPSPSPTPALPPPAEGSANWTAHQSSGSGGCTTPTAFQQGVSDAKAGKSLSPPNLDIGGYAEGYLIAKIILSDPATQLNNASNTNNAVPSGKFQSSGLRSETRANDSSGSGCTPPPPPPNLQPSAIFGPSAVGSIDPNEKDGPMGDGSSSYYMRIVPFPYDISFENSPTATAPAAQVVVTDQLDPTKVDISTVQLIAFTFGTNIISVPSGVTNYNTLYNINSSLSVLVQGSLSAQTGLLTWTFTSIDPSTGLPPTDPTVGFLPPDTDGVSGQGSVIFSVAPKAADTTGTVISNMATVVFDANAPINTPIWSNTLDVTPPTSSVAALPATTDIATFTVNWSGTDTGSGVAFYDIYVSLNGGAYSIWQSQTTATSASYTASAAGSYSFYSIATDKTGNVESPKSAAEATTQVILNPSFTLAPSQTSLSVGPGQSGTLNLSVTPVNGFNAAVTFTCSGLPAEASCSFSPATVTPNGTAAASTTLTILTTAPSAQVRRHFVALSGWTGSTLAAGLLLIPLLYKKRRLGWMLVLLGAVTMLGLSSCGGSGNSSSSSNSGTPAGSSTVTIMAVSGAGSGALSQSTSVTLTVQ